jgi:hypothetical protein
MLLAQVDMFLLELTTDVIAIYFVTRWYIKNRNEKDSGNSYASSDDIVDTTDIVNTRRATVVNT